MTKIKVYAVRYKEDVDIFLNKFYSDSTVESDINDSSLQLFIINNYGKLDEKNNNKDKVTYIFNNEIRPNFSTGHLSRNWNQAIINGFVDLDNPDCDAVVCMQIDAYLDKEWYQKVKKIVTENDDIHYFCCGNGDECQVFKPAIIKKVGLFDERFCSIFYQEADYFLRAMLNAPQNTVFLDFKHLRVFNEIIPVVKLKEYIFVENNTENERQPESIAAFNDSLRTGSSTHKYFQHKWPCIPCAIHWNTENILKTIADKPEYYKHKEYMLYPYFEDYGKIDKSVYVVV